MEGTFNKNEKGKGSKPRAIIEHKCPIQKSTQVVNIIRCKVTPIDNSFEYRVKIYSKKELKDVRFSVFVGTDDSKSENKIDIKDYKGEYEGNILRFNLKKGLNEILFTLNDGLKHSIHLQKIDIKDEN